MGINLKTSQLTNKAIPGLNDLFRFISGGYDYNISWSQILAALGLSANQSLSIVASGSATIQLVNTVTATKATIDYTIKRGARYRAEQLQVLTNGTTAVILSSGYKTIPVSDSEDAGIAIAASVVSGFAVLTITTDGSDANTSVMTYKVTFNG